MAATNFTPISLYYTTTAAATPSAGNLVAGELALNTVDEKLYFKNSAGTVKLLASTAGSSGDVVGPASATDNALARFDLTTGKLIQNSVGILSDAGILTGLTGITSSGSITLSGSSSVSAFKTPNIAEVNTISATAATGTINYDVTTQSVLYFTTNASGNFTVNFRGSSGTSLNTVMSTGESLSATFLVTNGATAYYNSVVQVDGSTVTPKWQGGTAPTSGNASSVDSYTYVIIKTGSATFTVLASQTKFA